MNKVLFSLGLCCVLISTTFAEQPSPKQQSRDARDREAIQQLVNGYVQAFNAGDAKRLGRYWADDAVYVHRGTGEQVQGRQAIQSAFAEVFKSSERAELEVAIESIRFPADTVAIEDGVATLITASQPPKATAYTAVYVKQNGKWLLDSVREGDAESPPSHFENLRDLSWMVGDWVDKDETATVRTTCKWTKNKNFLTRSFSVEIDGQVDAEGTQVIGWDASKGKIRSWVFDSNGGFSEGLWKRDGDQWTITINAVLPDGGTASEQRIMTRVDDNTFTWRSVHREVNGELLPSIDKVTIVRETPQ